MVKRFQLLIVALSKALDLTLAAAADVLEGVRVAVEDGAGAAMLAEAMLAEAMLAEVMLAEAMNMPAATVMVAIAAVIKLVLVLLVFMVFSSVDDSTLGRWVARKN